MECMMGKLSRMWLVVPVILFVAVSALWPGGVFASKTFARDEVVIVGKGFVEISPYDEGVVLESKKGVFEPTRFIGVEGTAALLFLHNRITRDMGIDIVLRTYKNRIDRRCAEEKVDRVLQFYSENGLIFTSRFEEKPATKIGIMRFRI